MAIVGGYGVEMQKQAFIVTDLVREIQKQAFMVTSLVVFMATH